MRDNMPNTKECLVYPGEYIPLPEVEALLEELKLPRKDSVANALVNMDEFKDCFRIEVILPGAQREDIFITVQEYILSIVVLHKNCEELKKKYKIHEFENKCIERHILLPDNADPEFIVAEYRQGVLHLHIPKTNEPSKTNINQIAVY